MHYANVMDASIKYSKAYYLVEKTSLTFEQIANYCDISALEVKAIADGLSTMCRSGFDLVLNGLLTIEEIKLCEKDKNIALPKRSFANEKKRSRTRKKSV